MHYIWIGLGGALGAVARVLISSLFPASFFNIPMKILCINVIGCFVIGFLVELMAFQWSASPNTRAFLVQGLLGGFTTFSAFAIEFGLLYEKGFHFLAIFYALLSVILSISFFFLGLRILRAFF